MAFTKDGSVGFCGAGDNTVGSKIIKTVDQGVTWTQQWPDGNPTFDLFLVVIAPSPHYPPRTAMLLPPEYHA